MTRTRLHHPRAAVLALAVAALLLPGTAFGTPDAPFPRQPRAWTVMVYLDADNNLEGAGIEDLNEMEQVGSTAEVTVLVQMDRIPGYDSSDGDWTETRRYLVTQDTSADSIGSTLLANLGEANMGDPDTLVDFVTWGAAEYPADHYLVVIWDHGEGWRKVASQTGIKGVAFDDSDYGDFLSTVEIGDALAGIHSALGRKLDILAYDACLMQMIEVAYEAYPYADYHVASEELVPLDGYPYDDFLAALTALPSTSPSLVSQMVVDMYVQSFSGGSQGSISDITLSAVDLAQMSTVAGAIDALAVALVDALPVSCEDILTWWSAAQPYGFDYRDLKHFALLLEANMPPSPVRSAAAGLVDVLDAVVIAEGHTGEWQANAHGLSIYYPPPDYYEPPYGLLAFGQDTEWDAFLAAPMPCEHILPDAYEPDDVPAEASYLIPGETQEDHWFYRDRDDDWARFNGEAGVTYCIGTRNLGLSADTFMQLFDSTGSNLITYDDDGGAEPWASLMEWSCPTSDSYLVLVQDYWYLRFGLETSYDLFVKVRRFWDVPGTHWAFHDIDACCGADIVTGYPDGLYCGWSAVTRDQMAVYMARALADGEENVPAGPLEPTFDDVPTDYWAFDHIEHCLSSNVVQGYTATTYAPTVQVTRDQMAVYVARALVAPTGEAALADYVPSDPRNFPDVPDTFWSYKHIEYCVENDVVQGYADGYYHPESVVTREQMAVFICRAFDLMM